MALYLFSNVFGSPELSQPITSYFIELTDSPGSLPASLPTFGSYEQRLLEPPVVSEVITQGLFGLRNFGSLGLKLNNSDLIFDKDTAIWGWTLRVWKQEALNRTLIYKGVVRNFSVSIEAIINCEDQSSQIFNTLLPKRIINTTDFPKATDFERVQIAFGLVPGHPAWYIDYDHIAKNYYYMLGEGLGNDGNGWIEIFQVYSDDAVMEDTEGIPKNLGSDWVELETQDIKADSWYQNFWVSIEDGGGNELEIHPVTSYIANKAYITPETFSTSLFDLPILDNFNRANQDPIVGWTTFDVANYKNLAVVSNQLKRGATGGTGNYGNAIYSMIFNADQAFYFTIVTRGGDGQRLEIHIRAQDIQTTTLDAYIVELTRNISGNDAISILRVDNGIGTQLGALDTSVDFLDGDGFRLSMQGSVISVWRRSSGVWSLITTRSDSTYPLGGKFLIWIESTTWVLDDFGGGNIPARTYHLREWRFYNGNQVSPFPTYAILHFKKQLVNQGRLRTITVDANALQGEKTILGLLRGLLENATWGLGQTVDNAIWISESALQPPINLGSSITSEQQAIDILSGIQKLWGVKLYTTAIGIAVWIDKTQASIATYGFADGYWNNVLKDSYTGVQSVDGEEIIKNLNLRYRFNQRKKEYLMSYSRVVNATGVDAPLDLPYIFESVSADRVASRLGKVSQNMRRFIEFSGNVQTLDSGDVIKFIAPKHGITVETDFKIISLQKSREALGIKANPYVDTTVYVPGTLPNDPNGDSTITGQIVPDFSTTPPNPVTGLTVTAFTRITEEGIIESFFKVRFTPPEDNYSDSIIQIKLSSEATTEYRQVARVVNYAEIKAISKGTNHDIQVIPYNAAGTLSGAISQALNQVSAGDTLLPKAPTGLAGSAGKDTLEWIWNAVTQNSDNSALINLLGYLYEITNSTGSVIYVPLTLTSSIKVPYLANTGNLTTTITRYLRVAAKKQNGLIGSYTTRILGTTKQINTLDIGTLQITNPIIGGDAVDENKRIDVYQANVSESFSVPANSVLVKTSQITHNLGRVVMATVNTGTTSAIAGVLKKINLISNQLNSFQIEVGVVNITASAKSVSFSWNVYYW